MSNGVVLTKENAEATFGGLVVKRPGQQIVQGVCMSIYGQGGAGKTDTVSKVVELGKTLHIDVESGTDVLAHLGDNLDYDIVEPDTYAQFQKITDALVKDHTAPDGKPYVNLIVDNLSELVDRCETHMGITGNGSHDLQNYKLVKLEILKRVRLLRDLSRKYGLNVFFLCWDADEKDERGVLKKDLALTPALRKEFPGMINIIAHVRVISDPSKRTLDLAPSPKSVAKFRRAANSSAQAVPFVITYSQEQSVLVDVIKSIKEGAEWPSDKYKAAKGES